MNDSQVFMIKNAIAGGYKRGRFIKIQTSLF